MSEPSDLRVGWFWGSGGGLGRVAAKRAVKTQGRQRPDSPVAVKTESPYDALRKARYGRRQRPPRGRRTVGGCTSGVGERGLRAGGRQVTSSTEARTQYRRPQGSQRPPDAREHSGTATGVKRARPLAGRTSARLVRRAGRWPSMTLPTSGSPVQGKRRPLATVASERSQATLRRRTQLASPNATRARWESPRARPADPATAGGLEPSVPAAHGATSFRGQPRRFIGPFPRR